MTARERALRREEAGPLGRPSALVLVLCAAIFLFLAAPTLVVVPISFSAAPYLTFPPPGWSLQWYARYFSSQTWMSGTWLSFEVALLTMVTATALGTAASLGLRRPFRGRPVVGLTLIAPLVVPVIIIAVATYEIYARLRLVGTVLGLVLAHTVMALPFVVIVVRAALRGLDPTLELAAQSLGASGWQTFRLVSSR